MYDSKYWTYGCLLYVAVSKPKLFILLGVEKSQIPKFLYLIIEYLFLNGIWSVIANINQDDEYYHMLSWIWWWRLKLFLSGRCRNCRTPAVGRLCLTCLSRRECGKCTRRLCEGLFESAGHTICKTCQRKLDKPYVRVNRSAFGGIIQEVALDVGAEDIGDLESFFRNRVDDIRSNLRRSIEQNKWVNSYMFDCELSK